MIAAQVVAYTTRTCGYCRAATQLLRERGIPFREIAVDRRPDLREWLVRATGRHTVPQIFINGTSIGGYASLARMAQAGHLEARLENPPLGAEAPLPS